MSKSQTDKSATNAPLSIPLIFVAALAAVGFGWMTANAWLERHQPTFEWSNVVIPGVVCLLAVVIFIWAISPRK